MIQRAFEIPSVHLALMAARGKVVVDLGAPEHFGGRWLQPLRDAAERLRRLAFKAKKKSNLQSKKKGN